MLPAAAHPPHALPPPPPQVALSVMAVPLSFGCARYGTRNNYGWIIALLIAFTVALPGYSTESPMPDLALWRLVCTALGAGIQMVAATLVFPGGSVCGGWVGWWGAGGGTGLPLASGRQGGGEHWPALSPGAGGLGAAGGGPSGLCLESMCLPQPHAAPFPCLPACLPAVESGTTLVGASRGWSAHQG